MTPTAIPRSPNLIAAASLGAALLLVVPLFFFPSWGGALAVLSPVPLAVACLLAGFPLGSLVAAGVAGTAAALGGLEGLGLVAAETVLPGFLLALAGRWGLDYPRTVILTAGLTLLAHLGGSLLLLPNFAARIPAGIESEVDRAAAMMADYFRGQGTSQVSSALLATFREAASMLFPAMVAAGSLVNALFCAAFVRRLTAAAVPDAPSFRDWRLPDHLIWVFLASSFALVYDPRLLSGSVAGGLLVLALLYTLQGAAVGLTLAERRQVGTWTVVLVMVSLIIWPFLLAPALLLTGLIDFRFDFRQRIPAGVPPKNGPPTG